MGRYNYIINFEKTRPCGPAPPPYVRTEDGDEEDGFRLRMGEWAKQAFVPTMKDAASKAWMEALGQKRVRSETDILDKEVLKMGRKRSINIGEYCERLLGNLTKNSNDVAVFGQLTKPVSIGDSQAMPLPVLAATGQFETLRFIAAFVQKNCHPSTAARITAAQIPDKSPAFPIGKDMELDPSWTLYHVYAAAGSAVRKRLGTVIDRLAGAELWGDSPSGLFTKDRNGRVPLELALQNCDPTGGVLLMEKTFRFLETGTRPADERMQMALDIIERAGDSTWHSILMRGYELTSSGLLTQQQFFRMAKALRDYNPDLMWQEMNVVLGNTVERNDVGFFRAALGEFCIPIGKKVFMYTQDKRDTNPLPGWIRMCMHVEDELQARQGTCHEGELLPSALMLKACVEYIDGALRALYDNSAAPLIEERQAAMRKNFPLCTQTLHDMEHAFDTTRYKVSFDPLQYEPSELSAPSEQETETAPER